VSLQDNVILWNKDENQVSEIGPDGIEEGTVSHETCKFNNGWRFDAGGEGVKFANLDVVNSGAIEFWARLRGMNIVDGAGDISFCRWWMWHTGLASGTTFQYMMFFNSGSFWRWQVLGVGSSFAFSNPDFDIADGELAHYLFVWDTGGIDGGPNVRRLYVDGVLMEATNVGLIDMTGFGINDFELGNENWGANRRYPARATIDNVKDYQNITESIIQDILNNRENEGFLFGRPRFNRFNRIEGVAT